MDYENFDPGQAGLANILITGSCGDPLTTMYETTAKLGE